MATILGIGTGRFLQFWISVSLRYLPSSFCSIDSRFGRRRRLKNFKMKAAMVAILDIATKRLAILNLSVTPMLPIKLWLKPTYGLGGDVVWRIWRWPLWQLSWISERNDFSNSEPLCGHKASHKISAQSELRLWRRCRKYKKLTTNEWRTMDNRPRQKLTWS